MHFLDANGRLGSDVSLPTAVVSQRHRRFVCNEPLNMEARVTCCGFVSRSTGFQEISCERRPLFLRVRHSGLISNVNLETRCPTVAFALLLDQKLIPFFLPLSLPLVNFRFSLFSLVFLPYSRPCFTWFSRLPTLKMIS